MPISLGCLSTSRFLFDLIYSSQCILSRLHKSCKILFFRKRLFGSFSSGTFGEFGIFMFADACVYFESVFISGTPSRMFGYKPTRKVTNQGGFYCFLKTQDSRYNKASVPSLDKENVFMFTQETALSLSVFIYFDKASCRIILLDLSFMFN